MVSQLDNGHQSVDSSRLQGYLADAIAYLP